MDKIRAAKRKLEAAEIEINAIDHLVKKSRCPLDANGNGIEFFVGATDYRKLEPRILTFVEQLEI